MARYQPKLPAPDISSARSWVGKPIRDAYKNELGLVYDVTEERDGLYLMAKFPGEDGPRKIALHPQDDNEYIFPGVVKARYRPPSDNDMKRIAAFNN